MAVNKAYDQYKENSIISAKPEELTLMLYNGLIKFIMRAQASIEKKNMENAHNNIIKSQDIILEFQLTLDMNYEVSQGLMLLYDYMYRRLVDANVKKDKAILEEVLGFARQLRDTWQTAMKMKYGMTAEGQAAVIQSAEEELLAVSGAPQPENAEQQADATASSTIGVEVRERNVGQAVPDIVRAASVEEPVNQAAPPVVYPADDTRSADVAAMAEDGNEPEQEIEKPAKLVYASQYAAMYSRMAKAAKAEKESKLSIQERL